MIAKPLWLAGLSSLAMLILATSSPVLAQQARVIDRTWSARPGDRAVLHDPEDLPKFVAPDLAAYIAYVKASNADDGVGLRVLMARKQLDLVDSGTPVLVVDRHDDLFPPGSLHPIEVQILAGTRSKGVKVWVDEGDVARPVEPAADPAKLKARTTHAASVMAGARKLEKVGKVKAAMADYRHVVEEYADTPSAKLAAARLKVLADR